MNYQELKSNCLLSIHSARPERYPHLLESVAKGACQSRFDILFAFPGDVLQMFADNSIKKNGEALQDDSLHHKDILSCFDKLWAESVVDNSNVEKSLVEKDSYLDIPFHGGWFVFLAYELAAIIEPGLPVNLSVNNALHATPTPIATFTRIPAAIILDHKLEKVIFYAENDDKAMLDFMREDLMQSIAEPASGKNDQEKLLDEIHEDNANDYYDCVKKIKNYIVEGDVFQVNLSRKWLGKIKKEISAADIYKCLKKNNPAPFAGISVQGSMSIISSSPERLVKVSKGKIETRPIAGTRPRGIIKGDIKSDIDSVLSAELIADPKERAEHIMLIDLMRNDLGRVCIPGSITVNELMTIESYSHVHHIVSNIQGELQSDITPGMIIRAVFPGGTITGCPKVRCMHILAELEESARGAYTGSMGYINNDGSLDLNILIRTIELTNKSLVLRAGGGIVADSDSENELHETRAKARGLLMALGLDLDLDNR